MGNYGIRISKEGVDVKTANDVDTIFNSKFALLKGSIEGTGLKTVPTVTTQTVTVTHSLGYIPFSQLYVEREGSNDWFQAPVSAAGAGGTIDVWAYTTATTLVITFDNQTTGSIPFNYQYFIFLDKGKL